MRKETDTVRVEKREREGWGDMYWTQNDFWHSIVVTFAFVYKAMRRKPPKLYWSKQRFPTCGTRTPVRYVRNLKRYAKFYSVLCNIKQYFNNIYLKQLSGVQTFCLLCLGVLEQKNFKENNFKSIVLKMLSPFSNLQSKANYRWKILAQQLAISIF